MAERDRFELDLAAGLRAYLEEAPTEVRPTELARQFAEAYPHGRPVFGVRGLLAVPRVAWVLLLLAGLLLALVGGMLVAGSHLRQELPAVVPEYVCPPGSTPDEPGPIDQARPTGAGPTAFDRAAGRIVMLADEGTWTYDVCTNTWTLMQSGSGPQTGLALVYDPRADLIIGVEYGDEPPAPVAHAWTYDSAANTWTRKGPAPDHVARLWYDTASAQVGAWTARSDDEPGTIWTYDVASDTWAAGGALEVLGGYGWNTPGDLLAYDAALDRVVTTGGTRTRLLDLRTNTVADARAVPPWAGNCYWMSAQYCYGQVANTPITYDEASESTVVLVAGRMFAYDAAADRWDMLIQPTGTGPGELARGIGSMVYDPVNDRLVVMVQFDLFRGVDAVVAFDTPTLEWTVLLEPVEGQPAPGSE